MQDYSLVDTTVPPYFGSIIFCKLNKAKLLVSIKTLKL
jgi:hypothetical protein